MNEEYLKAKVDLCLNLAEEDIKQQEIARAIKNLERENLAKSDKISSLALELDKKSKLIETLTAEKATLASSQ